MGAPQNGSGCSPGHVWAHQAGPGRTEGGDEIRWVRPKTALAAVWGTSGLTNELKTAFTGHDEMDGSHGTGSPWPRFTSTPRTALHESNGSQRLPTSSASTHPLLKPLGEIDTSNILAGNTSSDPAPTLFLAGGVNEVSFTTWNAQALLCADPVKLKKKKGMLQRILFDNTVTMLQDVHVNPAESARLRERTSRTHCPF